MELQQRLTRDLEMFEALADNAAEHDNWGAHHDWLVVANYIRTVLADEGEYVVAALSLSSHASGRPASLSRVLPPDGSQLALTIADPAIAQLEDCDEGS
jgi:hypothetical protein